MKMKANLKSNTNKAVFIGATALLIYVALRYSGNAGTFFAGRTVENNAQAPQSAEQGFIQGQEQATRQAQGAIVYSNNFPVHTGDSLINNVQMQEKSELVLPDGIFVIESEADMIKNYVAKHAGQIAYQKIEHAVAQVTPPVAPSSVNVPAFNNTFLYGGGNNSVGNSVGAIKF